MSATITRIRSAVFGAAVAASLAAGAAAARAEPAPPASDARHCYAYTQTAERCRYHCSTLNATGYTWDPYTGCCVCTFF